MRIQRRRILPVTYSPLDGVLLQISQHVQASMVGLVSVSAAGLKTVNGMIASVAGGPHSLHLFLLERTESDNPKTYQLKRFSSEEYKPKDILRGTDATVGDGCAVGEEVRPMSPDSELITGQDLRIMDLLFCDSVATTLIHHRNKKTYELLSDSSLERIVTTDSDLRMLKAGTTKAESDPDH